MSGRLKGTVLSISILRFQYSLKFSFSSTLAGIIIIIIIIIISGCGGGSNSVRKFQIEITWRVDYFQVNLKYQCRYSAVGQVRGGQYDAVRYRQSVTACSQRKLLRSGVYGRT